MQRRARTVVVAHGALTDCSILAKRGIVVNRLFDTQIAHACLEGGEITSMQINYAKIVKKYPLITSNFLPIAQISLAAKTDATTAPGARTAAETKTAP